MKSWKVTLVTLALSATSIAQGAEYKATVIIRTEVILQGREGVSVGVVRLKFSPVPTFGPCRNESADIYNTAANSHLLKKAYLYEALGKSIEVTVDDTITRYDATVCHVMMLK